MLLGLGCALLLLFALVRWHLRRPLLQSDDVVYLDRAARLLAGDQPLVTWPPTPDTSHHDFRWGILAPLAALVGTFGKTLVAYRMFAFAWAAAGFLFLWRIHRRLFGLTAALALAAVHTVLPFETQHASNLLTDLPAALLLLVAIVAVSGATRERWLAPAVVAGLALAWGYGMRTNQIAFALPALGVLWLVARQTRRAIGGAIVIVGAVVLAEQIVWVVAGREFGFRWHVVRANLDDYLAYFPRVPWYGLIPRMLVVSWRSTNAVIGACYTVVLLLHGWVLLRGTTPLVRAVATMGLTTWAVFSLYFFGIDEATGELIVMGFDPRFVQASVYSGLIVAGATLFDSEARARLLRDLRLSGVCARVHHSQRRWIFAIGYVLVLAASLHAANRSFYRLSSRRNPVNKVLRSFESPAQPRVRVGSPKKSCETLHLYSSTPDGTDLAWLCFDDLDQLQASRPDYVLLDHLRSTAATGFTDSSERKASVARYARLLRWLRANFEVSVRAGRYEVFRMNRRPAPS